MKLLVSNIGWHACEDETILPLLKDAGAEGVEVAPGRLFEVPAQATKAQAQTIRTRFDEAGLPIGSMQALLFGQPDLHLFGGDQSARDLVAYLARIIAIAGDLGCGPLVFGSPRNRLRGALSFDEAIAQARPYLRELGQLAADAGCCFCVEANARDYGCDFMNRLAEAHDVALAVDHPGVRVVADTGNMIMEEEPAQAVSRLGPCLAHLHVSAPQLGPVRDHMGYIGQAVSAVRSAGYDGNVTLEMRAPDGRHAVDELLDNLAALRAVIDKG